MIGHAWNATEALRILEAPYRPADEPARDRVIQRLSCHVMLCTR